MYPTCKLKTFHEYKTLISFKFKFANKVKVIAKMSSKFPTRYVNTTFNFLGNFLVEEGKYFVTESSDFCLEWWNLSFTDLLELF